MSQLTSAAATKDVSRTGPGRSVEALEGLCANCIHAKDCVLRREGSVVLFCEEFEAVGREERRVFPVEVHPEPPIVASEGLCATCENRETCQLRPAEGGVWYCEEYR